MEIIKFQQKHYLGLIIVVLSISLGCVLLMPIKAQAAVTGDLIKSPNSPAVYYLGNDGKKYAFPDDKVYYSWYQDFSTVQTVTLEEMQSYPFNGNVITRAGTKLLQFVAINPDGTMIVDDPKVYALGPNGTRHWITTAEIAESLYGEDWESNIYPCPNYLFADYTLGADITDAVYTAGSVVKQFDISGIYYINEAGEKQLFEGNAFLENMFLEDYVNITSLSLDSYPIGESITSNQPSLISVAASTPANQTENEYYVATNGNDNNNGSLENPFLTISKAAEVATVGDIVYIRSGVYEETVRPENSGQEGSLITFTSYPGETVELRGTEGYGFYLGDGVSYIKIDNLTITRSLGEGVITIYPEYKAQGVVHGAAVKMEAAHHNLITNNIFYDNDIGVFLAPHSAEENASTYNQIINNQIYNSGEAGIRNKRSDYTTIDSNTIYNNGLKDNPVYSEPTSGIVYYCTIGTTITNNTIYGNSGSAIDNYAGTNASTCDAESSLIEDNILVQTIPGFFEDRITYNEYIVLSIAEQEIGDSSHIYRNNTFYNGYVGSDIIAWGLDNESTLGTLMTVAEFNSIAGSVNPNNSGNVEVTSNPIQ